jgi:hypothetical protein
MLWRARASTSGSVTGSLRMVDQAGAAVLRLGPRRGRRWRGRHRPDRAPNRFPPVAIRAHRRPVAARARSAIPRAAWNRGPDRVRDCGWEESRQLVARRGARVFTNDGEGAFHVVALQPLLFVGGERLLGAGRSESPAAALFSSRTFFQSGSALTCAWWCAAGLPARCRNFPDVWWTRSCERALQFRSGSLLWS